MPERRSRSPQTPHGPAPGAEVHPAHHGSPAAGPGATRDHVPAWLRQYMEGPGAATTSNRSLVKHLEPRAHVVQAGDTLSGIARRRLGSASRWEEIYRLNRGRSWPGVPGRLDDPHLIRPGWSLELPAAGDHPAPTPHDRRPGQRPAPPAQRHPLPTAVPTPVGERGPGAAADAAGPEAPGTVEGSDEADGVLECPGDADVLTEEDVARVLAPLGSVSPPTHGLESGGTSGPGPVVEADPSVLAKAPAFEQAPARGSTPGTEWQALPLRAAEKVGQSRVLAVPYANFTYKFPGTPWVDRTDSVGNLVFRQRVFSHLVLTTYPRPYHPVVAVENSGMLLETALASCEEAILTARLNGLGGPESGVGMAITTRQGMGTLSTGELRFVAPNSFLGIYHLRNYLPMQPMQAYVDRQQLFRLGGGFSVRVDVFPKLEEPEPIREHEGLLDLVRRFARDNPTTFALMAVGTAAVVAATLGPALIAAFGVAAKSAVALAGAAALAAIATRVLQEQEGGDVL